MRYKKLIPLVLSLLSVAILSGVSGNCLAQDYGKYEAAYDDGYDDGYDDAMEDCPCPPLSYLFYNALYVGLGVGYESYRLNQNIMVLDERVANLRTSVNGGLATLMFGYAMLFNNFYLAGELILGRRCAESTTSFNTFLGSETIKTTSGTTYGFNILPGYRLPTGPVVFAKIGYNRTEFSGKEYFSAFNQSNSSFSNWTNGAAFGVGVQSPIYQNFSARAEYTYINYSSFSNPHTGTRYAPSDNQASLSLIYSFNNLTNIGKITH